MQSLTHSLIIKKYDPIQTKSEDTSAPSLFRITLDVLHLTQCYERLSKISSSYVLTSCNQSAPTGVPCCKQW